MQKNKSEIARRGFLKIASLASVSALIGATGKAAETCRNTPPETSGPFYPGEQTITTRLDLTNGGAALGQIHMIYGKVIDQNCQPVPDAIVEIWQACASGKYNHQRDPNPAPLDPNFLYWGEALTTASGEFAFKTIKPGAYPASETWDRPPHIHFKVEKLGYRELITQMYFKGEPLNESDLILNQHLPTDRKALIVEFSAKADERGEIVPTGHFEIAIQKLT